MVSFYPGPSRVYDEIPRYVREAHRLGILSVNHRSPDFMALSKKTIGLLKKKLAIPENFTVFFTSSATECWEIIAQSLVRNESIHLFNGAFGEKWYDYTKRLHPASRSISFDRNTELEPGALIFSAGEVICITQNETSQGTHVSGSILEAIQKNNPGHLIAVDATSSMAGIILDFDTADVWFASVQKCFGLPAGLALMVLSPKAIERVGQLDEQRHYNSLTLMAGMMNKWQTPCTPNVLGIYLLMCTLQDREPIKKIHKEISARAEAWYSFFGDSTTYSPLISNPLVRSKTVIAVQTVPENLEKLRKAALREGFLLGEGYGSLKKETFRIANFPAIKKNEITRLVKFFKPYI